MVLNSIVDISKGKKHSESYNSNDYRYLQIEDLTSDVNIKYTSQVGVLVDSTDLIIAWDGANAGNVGGNLKGVIGSTLARLRPKTKEVDSRYLYHYLKSKNSEIRGKRTGATIPHVNGAELRKMEIPLPPLEAQKKIAAILDEADALRQKDKQLLKHYDDLLQSVFLDMFGDPVRNEKGHPKGTLRDVISEVKYGTSKPAEEDGNFPYLRMNNITYSGGWNFTSLKYINLESQDMDKFLVKTGDLLFNRTNSKELVGKSAVFRLKEPMAFAGYLIRIRPNEKANTEFIGAYLNSKFCKAYLQNMCKNIVGMANINAQELQTIPIYMPPKALQDEFESIVHLIEKERKLIVEQSLESKLLFQGLVAKAFTGELIENVI